MVSEQELLDSFPQVAPPNSHPGHPGHLTPEQEKALCHLRDLLKMQGYEARLDDATMLRFLRARKFDVGKSHEMFVECEKWRESFGVNTILDDFWYEEKEEVMKYYPQFYHKTDIEGRPVYYEILGGVDITAMYKITSQERMLKNLIWEYESFTKYRLPASSRKAGYLIETSCTIFDLKGVSLSTATQVYGYIREASTLSQNYYPERMGKFYVINAPFGFSAVWSVIKRFLDPVTVEKIHIYGHKYKSALLKQIPIENLPEQFGGKSKTNVPLYMADAGPWREAQYVGPEGMAPEFGTRPANAAPKEETSSVGAAPADVTAAKTAA